MIVFNPETALKLSRNVGKKISVIVIICSMKKKRGQAGTMWPPLENRSPRRGMSQCGSDEVTEPVYRLAYLRLDAPTHLASYQRST